LKVRLQGLSTKSARKQVVLFPARIDAAVMLSSEAWARLLRGQRNSAVALFEAHHGASSIFAHAFHSSQLF
jgi:hypothetical protein